jgi:hypothetical protein
MALLFFRRGTMPEQEQPPADTEEELEEQEEREEKEAREEREEKERREAQNEGLVLEEPGYGHGV